jgi:hypothetical protein
MVAAASAGTITTTPSTGSDIGQLSVRAVTLDTVACGGRVDRIQNASVGAQASIDGVGELLDILGHSDEGQMTLGQEVVDHLALRHQPSSRH